MLSFKKVAKFFLKWRAYWRIQLYPPAYWVPAQITQWSYLKYLCRFLRDKKAYQAYEKALGVYDPSIEFIHYDQVAFLSATGGSEVMNIYRKVTLGTMTLFEKIYLNTSQDLQRVHAFYQHIYPLIDPEKLRIPALVKCLEAKQTTIIYAEFFPQLTPIAPDNLMSCLLDTVVYLSQLPVPEDYVFDPEAFEAYVFYHDQKPYAQEVLKQYGFDVDLLASMESLVTSFPFVVTHNDLHGENLYQHHILIDFDCWGVYPIGYEVARLMVRMKMNDIDRLDTMLTRLHQRLPSHLSHYLNVSTYYFTFVMTARFALKHNATQWQSFIQSLYHRLQKALTKI